MSDIYDRVTELARRRGFIWPSSEIYGSVAGFIDYGPMGALLKRRIEDTWRDFYVIREGYYEIECPTVGVEPIYVASGHVKGFSDKMCQCLRCGEYLRADHAAAGAGVANAGAMPAEALACALKTVPCPSCGEELGDVAVFSFNLMFQTSIGPGSQRKGYLRPETAQGIFTDFTRLLRFYRDRLPFGTVQVGKSYRNEISPRQGMIRLREFTQAEAEIFVHPDRKDHPRFGRYASYRVPLLGIEQQQEETAPVEMTMDAAVAKGIIANQYVAYYVALTHDLLVRIGVDGKRLRFRQHLPDERAHYATDCWDAEVLSERFGWVELVGIADRTDYDLKAHSKASGTALTVFLPLETPRMEHRRRIIPDMKALGPRFRGKAKAVADAMAAAEPGPEGVRVTVDGETHLIPPSLYQVKEEDVEVRGVEVMPHVIEPSYGIDRMCYAVLEHAYAEEEVEGEVRRVLRFPPPVAPVQAAVFPLVNRDGLDRRAEEIHHDLIGAGILAEYDDSGAIGRRYRRQDEVGTPFALTVDYTTMEDGTVTLRDRDSMAQVRVKRENLIPLIRDLIDGTTAFSSLSP
ncbi:MAG: glycine--tRNA ligase [Methanomicrobiales archaeon]|nr:glycine--tRNA ligase [Methanomicrobiales archaeon]